MIKTVIFDIDGTMYDYHSCNELAMAELAAYCRDHFGMEKEVFLDLHRKAYQAIPEQIGYTCASVHNRLIRYQYMLEQSGQSVFPHAPVMARLYWGTMLDVMQPFEGLLEWLSQLKEQGIRIGVATNMTSYVQYLKLEKLGAAPYIDWLVISEEIGCEKPDDKFFQYCLEKAGVPAGECLFVGDSIRHDMEGAAAAGMHTLHYAPGKAGQEKAARTQQNPVISHSIASYLECLQPGFSGKCG